MGTSSSRIIWTCAIGGCLLLLSLLAVFNQVKARGLGWQEVHYRAHLERVFHGTETTPAQYRLLSDDLTVLFYRGFIALGIPRPVGVAFVLIRLFQNLAIFTMALLYYRRLGISWYLGLLGVVVLTWSMTLSNHQSTLAVNTYTEILLYLLAGWALAGYQFSWILPITLLAALNRETSVFIPIMSAGAYWSRRPGESIRDKENPRRLHPLAVALSSFFIYLGLFFAIREYFGPREWSVDSSPIYHTWLLFTKNVSSGSTWMHMVGTLGLVPLLALATLPYWRKPLSAFFWMLVPTWFLVHLLLSNLSETRVLLVPQALVFIPGMLCGVQYWMLRTVSEKQGGELYSHG